MKPYYKTSDGKTVKLYHGDVIDVLSRLRSGSVQCVVTSPPYWGLRDYGTAEWEGGKKSCKHNSGRKNQDHKGKITHKEGYKTVFRSSSYVEQGNHSSMVCYKCGAKRIDQQLGSEKTPEEFVAKMVEVFREVRRVLRDDGTLFLNFGDSYGDNGQLQGIPWRVALALQADGWVLRQDIIWCLSGGTYVYVRSQKGVMPMMVRDLARLDPKTVQLWNGEKWTQLKGMSKSKRKGDEIELVLRSGERISCTPDHRFPVGVDVIKAKDLVVGNILASAKLPEPVEPKTPKHIGLDAAWFAGLYLAEGSNVNTGKMQIAGHVKEEERWEKVQQIAKDYGGSATRTIDGNCMNIRVYGKLLCAIVKELISGKTAKNKGVATVVWNYSNEFVTSLMDGYLHGDGCEDDNRWRLGFCRNDNLQRDIRTACARLGWTLTLKPGFSECNGEKFPSYKGEIRKETSGYRTKKDRSEIIEIRKARCREVYDLGVADDPHTFALASGILTCNSKPNPMPESVRNRCTKSHEYVFLLTKRGSGYFYDADAIREKSNTKPHARGTIVKKDSSGKASSQNVTDPTAIFGPDGIRNKRSVWNIPSESYEGAHFATFPRKLITPCILAGTSEKGACIKCGSPGKRITDSDRQPTRPGLDSKVQSMKNKLRLEKKMNSNKSTLKSFVGNRDEKRHVTTVKTVGWEPTCNCGKKKVKPCVVLDPFIGSGTTCIVSIVNDRRSIGIDLSEDYLKNNAIPRIEGTLLDIPDKADLVPVRKNKVKITGKRLL